MKQITGNKLLVKALKEEGVEYLFGYPGACTIDISDELYKQDEIKIVLPRHEQALVHEADAYARTTGKVGVCLVTSGPGATNLVTGLATANYDSVPLVCFTGQVARHLIGNDAFQEDLRSMEHFEKSIIPVIESVYPSFTPLERTVADFFIHNTDESDLSARHVSELLYVSEASLSRFAKKCGYTGYREFVYRYQEGLNAALPGTDDHIKQVLNTYQELLNKSYSLADRAQIDRICHILTSKRRVYVYGLGSSGLSAQEMKLRFMLAGVDIEAITDIHIMKMNAVLLNESCAAIGITVSGQTPEVLRALGAAKEKGASTILFTSRSSSDYDAFCDEVLLLAVKEHLKNGGAISPQFPILVMIDVLYSHFLTTDSERKEALYEYAVTKLHET